MGNYVSDKGTFNLWFKSDEIDFMANFFSLNTAVTISYAFLSKIMCAPSSANYNPIEVSCYNICPTGHYADANNICLPCHYSCYKCDSPLESECTNCNATDHFREAGSSSDCVCL